MLKSLFKNIFKIGSAVVIFCTFLSYLAPYVHPRWSTSMSHFATIFPWLLIANIGFLLFWAFGKSRFVIYHALLLVIGWQHITAFVGLAASEPKSSKAVTVMSHNVGNLLKGKNLPAQWDKAVSDYLQFVKRNGDPDILCLQECEGVVRDLLVKKSGYPYNFNQGKGTITFSRHGMDAGGDIPFSHTGNSAHWVNIDLFHKKMRLYNIHLQSNSVSVQADKLIKSGDIESKETWLDLRRILGRVGSNTLKRAEQAEEVESHMKQSNLPILLCGDLNDTPNSYVYRILSDGLQDAFQTNGRGLGSTFSGPIPLLRIDYTLCSPEFEIFDAGVIRKNYSDHFPVYAVVELGE